MPSFKVCLTANMPVEIELDIEAENEDDARTEALAQAHSASDQDWQMCGDAFDINWQSIERVEHVAGTA